MPLRALQARVDTAMSEAREVMNIRQASQYLGVSRDTLYRYISEGLIPAFKLGSRWKFRKTILDRWMERKMNQACARKRRKPVAQDSQRGRDMFGTGKHRALVGLDIGSTSIKAVELRGSKQGYELVSFGLEPLTQDTVVDGAIMDAPLVATAISNIFEQQKVRTKNVATSVSGHSVIVKRVTLPSMSEEELYDRIQTEASQHIPFDIADVNLSYQLLESVDAQMDVLLVAVKKDKILNHTNVLAQAGKTPLVVDIDAFALQNSFEVNYDPDPGQTVALLNVGASV